MRTEVMVALGSAALFGISTPLAKMLVGSVSPVVHTHAHYPDVHHRHPH